MRKIIAFTHATLDGYIDEPHKWSFQYADEEFQDYGLKMTLRADALLLGRITYEGMAQAWPTRDGNPFADHVNSITKYVVASKPVDTTTWDPTVVIAGPDPPHQGRRRAPVSPRQHRHLRAPRHYDLRHRRRRPRLPSHLSPLNRGICRFRASLRSPRPRRRGW